MDIKSKWIVIEKLSPIQEQVALINLRAAGFNAVSDFMNINKLVYPYMGMLAYKGYMIVTRWRELEYSDSDGCCQKITYEELINELRNILTENNEPLFKVGDNREIIF